MLLLIDYREKKFIERMRGIVKTTGLDSPVEIEWGKFKMHVQVCNLPVGDFVIKKLHSEDVLCIIERKTITDLCASIRDGRFRQQKERMLEAVSDPQKVMYLIEGTKRCSKIQYGGQHGVMMDGAIHNLLFKHHFKVLMTESEEDTWHNMQHLCKKACAGDILMNFADDVEHKQEAPVKLKFKSDKICENILAVQLSVIPGISYNMAQVISSQYQSMKHLMDAYAICNTDKEREKMLSTVQVTASRKLGPSLSCKIYNALYGVDPK